MHEMCCGAADVNMMNRSLVMRDFLAVSYTRADSGKGIICPEQCNLTNKNLVFGII